MNNTTSSAEVFSVSNEKTSAEDGLQPIHIRCNVVIRCTNMPKNTTQPTRYLIENKGIYPYQLSVISYQLSVRRFDRNSTKISFIRCLNYLKSIVYKIFYRDQLEGFCDKI